MTPSLASGALNNQELPEKHSPSFFFFFLSPKSIYSWILKAHGTCCFWPSLLWSTGRIYDPPRVTMPCVLKSYKWKEGEEKKNIKINMYFPFPFLKWLYIFPWRERKVKSWKVIFKSYVPKPHVFYKQISRTNSIFLGFLPETRLKKKWHWFLQTGQCSPEAWVFCSGSPQVWSPARPAPLLGHCFLSGTCHPQAVIDPTLRAVCILLTSFSFLFLFFSLFVIQFYS